MHNSPQQQLNELEALREENKRLRDMLYQLANYVSINVRHNDHVLSGIISQAVLASYVPEEDEEE